jgi:hypothetical protein
MKQTNKFFKTTTFKQALRMGPRKFVKDYLFPAMRREHGLGFAMETWAHDIAAEGSAFGLDGIYNRMAPACHSVMCIGGTMQAITGEGNEDNLGRILGLEYIDFDAQIDSGGLFYRWFGNQGAWKGLSSAFDQAKTPLQKERIAEKAVMAAVRYGEKKAKARK